MGSLAFAGLGCVFPTHRRGARTRAKHTGLIQGAESPASCQDLGGRGGRTLLQGTAVEVPAPRRSRAHLREGRLSTSSHVPILMIILEWPVSAQTSHTTPRFLCWGWGASFCAFSPVNHRTRCSAVRATARGPGRRGDYHLAPTSGDNLILMSGPATFTATYPLCEPHLTHTPDSAHSEPK